MSAKERALEALKADETERLRRKNEGPRPFPVIGQLDDDGVEDVERPFLPDHPLTVWRVRQWMTGPQS